MEKTFRLVGPGGEPVGFERILASHGVADLPPSRIEGAELTTTLPVGPGRARRVTVFRRGRRGVIRIEGRPLPGAAAETLFDKVLWMLRMDENLSEFYELARRDPDLAWAAAGAGRLMRSATVFEDVVKTICTTNCAWSATERMVRALVEHLGVRAPGAPPQGWEGRTFPTPAAMAGAGEDFYRTVVRAGYRGAYLMALAEAVAGGDLDVEAWGRATAEELDDDELESALLALPGVGPYAAAHIMLLLGRYSRLILDSWTRPTYARLIGRKKAADAAIARRFRPYGRFAGLAFWLFLTRSWVDDGSRDG